MENPFDLVIYDRNLARQQALTDPVSASFTPRWGLGTGEIVTAVDDPANEWMQADGARLVARYKGEHLMSGWLYQRTGPLVPDGAITYDLFDDGYFLAWTQGWVVPSAGLVAASTDDPAQAVPPAGGHGNGLADGSGYYAWPTGVVPAETAIKRIIADNFARFPATDLRARTTVLPDQGRGADAVAAGVLPNVRFDALDTVVQPLGEWANLGVRIWQDPGSPTLSLDVWQPVTWSQEVTAAAGIITDGSYTVTGPSATRAVVGGPGDDTARAYSQTVDAAAEAALGFAIEAFVDGSGASLTWPSSLSSTYQVAKYFALRPEVPAADAAAFLKYLADAGTTAIADAVAKRGASVTLADTDSFTYGGSTGYHVGDFITVGTPEAPITERITETTLAFTTDGFEVTPTVGAKTDDTTTALAYAIRALALAAQKRATRQ